MAHFACSPPRRWRKPHPQIVHIAYTAGALDVDMGKLAISKPKNKDVLDFAGCMVCDHAAVNAQALDLAAASVVMDRHSKFERMP